MTSFNYDNFKAEDRILIVEVNWIGDILFTTPAIRTIRKKHPGAYIAALVVPRGKAVLSGNNYLDEVIVLDEEGRHKGLKGLLTLIRELKSRHFSKAYLFHKSMTRALCIYLAGIKKRVGFDTKKSAFLLTDKVALPVAKVHRADIYYYLADCCTIPESERYCDFFISPEDKKFVEDFLEKNNLGRDRNVVVMHVGGNWDLKRWPKKNFAALSDILFKRYGVDVIISGSYADYQLGDEIAKMAQKKPFVACGATTLKQLGALFQRSEMVVSADSGPLHIATAVEARTIALFGATAPEITGPFGRGESLIVRNKNHSCVIPCYNLKCLDNICMTSITVDQVLGEIEKKQWLKASI